MLKYLKIILGILLINSILNAKLKQIHGNKILKQPCDWEAIGSECAPGLECSFLYVICLKEGGQPCGDYSECESQK